MKKFLILLFLIALSTFANVINRNTIELIFQNRIELNNVFDCNYNCLGRRFSCRRHEQNIFNELMDQPIEKWKLKKDLILRAFLSTNEYQLSNYSKNGGAYIINNKLYVKILVSFLIQDSSGYKSYFESALNLLTTTCSYAYLKEYSREIIMSLEQNYSISYEQKIKLLAILNLTEKEKNDILQQKTVPLYIRARLGDSIAEDSLIGIYPGICDYRKKEVLVKNMLYIGSQKCIKTLILYFNQPVFFMSGSCVSKSIRYPILKGLRQLYPQEQLFNNSLKQIISRCYGKNDPNKVKEYIGKFKTWAKSNYGVVPIDPDPLPVMKGECRDITRKAKP